MQKARTASSEKQKVTLSCEQCRQRKTRCDKAYPCGACQRSHLECHVVRRCRLPRGRAVIDNTKDVDLKDRVARLDSLLTDLQSSRGPKAVQPEFLSQKAFTGPIEDGQGVHNETADSSFWTALNDQVAGIREILEEFPDDESDNLYSNPLPSATNSSSSQDLDIILFGVSSCVVNATLLEVPPRSIITALLDIYIYRVDSLLKVIHAPSVHFLLLSEEESRAEPLDQPAREALKFAICFTAVCTLTEGESQRLFLEGKDRTRNRLRLATEVMLSRANLLTTSDVTVLQAFVIYLAGRRTCPGYRKIWTLIATAVRIGQSLGLDTDESHFRTPFQMEIRRRLWYSIGILDMQAAFDGGSHSVIAINGVLGRPPLNIDDSVLSSAPSQYTSFEQPGLTDMSCSCMTYDGLICWRRLTHVPTDPEGQAVIVRQEWANRSQIVRDWEQHIHERYLQYCDSTHPFQRFMKFVGQDMIITMRLLERRPMHRLFSASLPPTDDFNVLECATDIVERSLLKFTDPSLAPWSWFAWVKWYALAIMLAELCGQSHGPLIDRAWKLAEKAFPTFADLVIDDVLWRSVEKLLRKAQSTRDSSRASSMPVPAPTCPRTIHSHGNMDSGRLNEEQNQSQDIECTWHTHVQSHDHSSQSMLNGDPPIEADQSKTKLLPADGVNTVPETIGDELDYMSWVNWELFVQDVGSFNEQDTLKATFGASDGTR